MYYLTRIGNDEFWIYLPLDFSERFEPGRLYCQQSIPIGGRAYKYEFDGLLMGMRLVVMVKSIEHNEPFAHTGEPGRQTSEFGKTLDTRCNDLAPEFGLK